jgi:hypothetical protein
MEISPPLPAGTMAALAVTAPVEELSLNPTGIPFANSSLKWKSF